MKLKKGYCVVVADVTVTTKFADGTPDKHGTFEKGVEDILQEAFLAYMKLLVAKVSKGEKLEWVTHSPHSIELVRTKKAQI